MLFLLVILFSASHSFASKDSLNSTNIKLVIELCNIIDPVISMRSNDICQQKICLTSTIQNKLIGRIQKHFEIYEDCDLQSNNRRLACVFFKEFGANYSINKKQQSDIIEILSEEYYHTTRKQTYLYPMPTQVVRNESETTSETVGSSYGSEYSIMSASSLRHSPRQRARSGSHVSFDLPVHHEE